MLRTLRKRWHGVLGGLAIAGIATPGSAVTWSEPYFDDAGDDTETAQVTNVLGAVDPICGDLTNDLVDVFKIEITDAGGFTACIEQDDGCASGGYSAGGLDATLWLFDSDGNGVLANELASVLVPSLDPAINESSANDGSGSSVSTTGVYYLAISHGTAQARSNGGAIFDFQNPFVPPPPVPQQISGPDGPGGGSPHVGWTGSPVPGSGKTYCIALTGVGSVRRACCDNFRCQDSEIDTCDTQQWTIVGSVLCTKDTCPQACCTSDGGCTELTRPECSTAGGLVFEGKVCSEVECTGACCIDELYAQCENLTKDDCDSMSGCWAGPHVMCPLIQQEEAEFAEHGIVPPGLDCGFDLSTGTGTCPASLRGGPGPAAANSGAQQSSGTPPFEDAWVTPAIAGSYQQLSVPAGMIDTGSDAFADVVFFQGVPLGLTGLGDADTIMQRSGDPFGRCDAPLGGARRAQIQLTQLSLTSVDPITVTFNAGQNPTLYDVEVTLSPVPVSQGALTAVKDHCNGGRYTADFFVQPRFVFTPSAGGNSTIFDTGSEGLQPIEFRLPSLSSPDAAVWAHDGDPSSELMVDYSSSFKAGAVSQHEACGDFDQDGDTDFGDYQFIVDLIEQSQYDVLADFDRDGQVDETDFDEFLCCFQCYDAVLGGLAQTLPIAPWAIPALGLTLLAGGAAAAARLRRVWSR